MLNPNANGRGVSYLKGKRRTAAASSFIPATSALSFPDIRNIPLKVFPDMVMVPPESLKEWAEILCHINPESCLKWGQGTKTDLIAGDIMNGLITGIENYSSRHGFTPDNIEDSVEDGKLQIRVYAFTSEDSPIFYTEAIESVKKSAPRMLKLVKDAFVLLGQHTRTWEDILTDVENLYEMDWGDEKNKEAKEAKENLELMKKQTSGYSLRKRKVSPKSLGKAMDKFKPRSKKEKEVAAWIKNIIQLTEVATLECTDPEQFDAYLSAWHVTPILFSLTDLLTDWYANDLDMEFNAGAFLGDCLFLTLGSEKHEKIGLRPYVDKFLSDVRALGLRQRIFSYF